MEFVKNFVETLESITDSLKLFDWHLQTKISPIVVKNLINYPIIIKIKQKFKLNKTFFFQCVSEATVRKVVKNLSSNKATAGKIPVKHTKK